MATTGFPWRDYDSGLSKLVLVWLFVWNDSKEQNDQTNAQNKRHRRVVRCGTAAILINLSTSFERTERCETDNQLYIPVVRALEQTWNRSSPLASTHAMNEHCYRKNSQSWRGRGGMVKLTVISCLVALVTAARGFFFFRCWDLTLVLPLPSMHGVDNTYLECQECQCFLLKHLFRLWCFFRM